MSIVMCMRNLFHNYTYKNLLEDVDKMDEIQKDYSLIAIKDTFKDHPGRFLVYYDLQWSCWFFPNVKTLDKDNKEKVHKWLLDTLKCDDIELNEEAQKTQTKKNPSNEDRIYHHTLYKAVIKDFNSRLKKDSFSIDGLDYKWMSIADMEKDERIMEENADVVHFVKDTIR